MKRFLKFSILLILILHLALNSQGMYPVKRGERPPIDLSTISANAFEPDKILVKIIPDLHRSIPDTHVSAKIGNYVITGIKELDNLNEKFEVTDYKPIFSALYSTNYDALKFRERHKEWGFHLWFELALGIDSDIHEVVAEFKALDEILIAEPVYKKELIGSHKPDDFILLRPEDLGQFNRGWAPNDPQFAQQWHYQNTGQTGGIAGSDINVANAWELEKGNVNVIVAVVDGGIDYNHPDLAANIWDQIGYNFVNNSPNIIPHNHGTHVAGTVAAVNNNGIGVSGVAGGSGLGDGVRLMSCQVFTSSSNGGFHLAPIYAADNGASISQNSWGYTYPGVYEQPVLDAIDYFNTYGGGEGMTGGITIFSAGNSNTTGQWFPACYEGAFSVAATNHNDQKAWYSTYDFWVDVSAPGGETNVITQRGVLSTLNNNSYGFYQGTSMAAPHCSGVAALLISFAFGSLDAELLADIIRNTTDDHYAQNPNYIGKLGTGRINALEALLALGTGNAPQNLSAIAGNNTIQLSWEPPDMDTLVLSGYNVYRDDVLINEVPIIDTTYTDSAVLNYISYAYYVKALYDTVESYRSNIVFATPFSGFAGGTGSYEDPYLISTAEQLHNVRFLPDSYFRQTNDIELGVPPWNSGAGWQPIGNESVKFSGYFNGDGHLINNLIIDRPGENYIGLFGYTQGAVIKKSGLKGIVVNGNNFTGSLIGKMVEGTINECFASGFSIGNNYSGGLCGASINGMISGSYVVVEAQGNDNVGGLTGFSQSLIVNCYSSLRVIGNQNVGGLIGAEENSSTLNSYWNVEYAAVIHSAGGEPKTTAQMIQIGTYLNWDFSNIWSIIYNVTYPWLKWQTFAGSHNYPPGNAPPSYLEAEVVDDEVLLTWQAPSLGYPLGYNVYRDGFLINTNGIIAGTNYIDDSPMGFTLHSYYVTAVYSGGIESQPSNSVEGLILGFSGGTGTPQDPYLIATSYQLDAVRHFLNLHFKQIADIELGEAPWNQGEGWMPIGGTNIHFTGSYNGGGHYIYNLYINKPNSSYIGLFGSVKGAELKNIFFENPFISGKYRVGTLVGFASEEAHIEYVRVKNATMHLQERYCGALAGGIDDVVVYRCYSSGTINRGSHFDWNSIGGLVGAMASSTATIGSYITECYSTADVTSLSHNSYGGLVGGLWHKGEIRDSYARGSVTGNNARAGGLSCDVTLGTALKKISNSYSTGLVSAPGADVRGFLGLNSGGTYSGNFWDTQTSSQSGSDPAAMGKTTAEMKNVSTFINSGWDFEEIWAIDTNQIINDGYPFLKWQLLESDCHQPTNFTLTEVTSSSARAEWLPGFLEAEWDIIWGEQGFDPTDDGTLVGSIYTTWFELTELENGSSYDLYLRSVCQEDEVSSWTGPLSFTTVSVFTVDGGGTYCAGDTPTGIDVILSGSDYNFEYQLFKDSYSFGPSFSGTGNPLIWTDLLAGEYTIYSYNGIFADWMSGNAIITEFELPTVFCPDDLFICIDASPFPVEGGIPDGGEYVGTAILNGYFHPQIAGIGSHEISYIIEDDNGCSNSCSFYISVLPIPSVVFELEIDSICINHEPIELTGGFPEGGEYFGNGVIESTFSPELAGLGMHNILYIYSDEFGCTSIDSSSLFVDACVYISGLSSRKRIEIFPNPANDMLIIHSNPLIIDTRIFKIYNLQGQLVMELKDLNHSNPFVINVSDLERGYYIFAIVLNDEILHKSFIKQ